MLYFPKDAISSLNPLPLLLKKIFNRFLWFQPIQDLFGQESEKVRSIQFPTTIYLLAD